MSSFGGGLQEVDLRNSNGNENGNGNDNINGNGNININGNYNNKCL